MSENPTPPFWPMLIIYLICQLVALYGVIRMLHSVFMNRERAFAIARTYDYLGNALANDMTFQPMSLRSAKAQRDGKRWGCWMCKMLDKVDPGHCAASLDDDHA